KKGGYVSKKARMMYPIWMISVFLTVLSLGRNKNLFCLGWETAFPALMASFFTGSKVVFDDADRFSMIVKLPEPFNKWLRMLEKWTSQNSFIHLVPGWTRYEWRSDNMMVLRNTPNLIDYESACSTSLERESNSFVVYINGWVGETRGAPVFVKALESIAQLDERIVFHVAGRVDSLAGELLIKHRNTRFYGEINQAEALAIYSIADVVLTYYDPEVEINRHAESNKWGDCVFFGIPFVVNSEVVTADKFTSSGAAWAVPYRGVDELVKLLVFLCNNPEYLKAASLAMAKHKEDYPVFDVQMEGVIKRIGEKR